MNDAVLFEDGGVKITPLTMTVEKGSFWSSNNEQTVEPLKAFPLNGVTEIRCVTITTSPLSELWRKLQIWKWHAILLLGVSVNVAFIHLADLSAPRGTEKWNTFAQIGAALLIVTVFVWGSNVLDDFIKGFLEGWKPLAILVGCVLLAIIGKQWSDYLFMFCLVVLLVAGIVHVVRRNPKHVTIRSRISLVRDNKEVVCYEWELFSGMGYIVATMSERQRREEFRVKQIVEALGAAIGKR